MNLTVTRLLQEKGKQFDLRLLAGSKGLDATIQSSELNRPGLAFAGYLDVYVHDRIQILGNTELSYVMQLEPDLRRRRLEADPQFREEVRTLAKAAGLEETLRRLERLEGRLEK
ncbi:MAG: hypothetical protein HC897_09010 [Thermoanaerobaculia bacterium]|nr:hypothetical protein [Thermoanaerobaculia bacterium]